MTVKEIDEILSGTFSDENERLYWIVKREEVARKEENAEENAVYFRKMAMYDR